MALGLPQIVRVFVLQVSSPEICSMTIVNQDEPSYSSAPMTLPVQKMAIKKAYISEDEIWPLLQTTVDGRNPAPAWMVKTLQINTNNGINHLSTGDSDFATIHSRTTKGSHFPFLLLKIFNLRKNWPPGRR